MVYDETRDEITSFHPGASAGVQFNKPGTTSQTKFWQLHPEATTRAAITPEQLGAIASTLLDTGVDMLRELMRADDPHEVFNSHPMSVVQAKPKTEAMSRDDLKTKTRFIFALGQDAQLFPNLLYVLFHRVFGATDWADSSVSPPTHRVFQKNELGRIPGLNAIYGFTPIGAGSKFAEALRSMKDGDI